MDKDTFTSSTNQVKNTKKAQEDKDNFFLNADTPIYRTIKDNPRKHINDYDFNLLKDDAYKEIDDKTLKLEYKISKAEDEIKILNQQIQASEDIQDYSMVEKYTLRRNQIQQELNDLIEIYNNSGLSAKITGGFATKIKEQISVAKNFMSNVTDSLISKLPGKFSSFIELKQSLNKLENINKSVDELMAIQLPYGDTSAKYDQLSKYIVRANSIQAEISRFMKK